MSALTSTHRPGRRLPELSPFELEPELKGARQAPLPESAYGCVEWFQYVEPHRDRPHPKGRTRGGGAGARRPSPLTAPE